MEKFVVLNDEAINRAKQRVDTRKWLTSKHRPKKYGDKVEMEVSGGIDHRHVMTEERRWVLIEERRQASARRIEAAAVR